MKTSEEILILLRKVIADHKLETADPVILEAPRDNSDELDKWIDLYNEKTYKKKW